jgi:hypothetical protein
MKIYNTILKAATLGIFAAAALAGCKMDTDDPKPQPDPVCECTDKEHFLPCDCPMNGTEKCDCTVKPRGVMTTDVGTVPIYITAGVTDTEATDMINHINAAYLDMKINSPTKYNCLDTLVKEIRIIDGSSSCEPDGNGKYIIKLKKTLDEYSTIFNFAIWVDGDVISLQLADGKAFQPNISERRGARHPFPHLWHRFG